MTWMKTVQNDLDSHGLSWTDAIDLVQNRPLWRLLATSGTTRVPLVMESHGIYEDHFPGLGSHGK